MKYLVTGCAIVNNITYVDGRKVENILGGCGIYAYSGIRMVTDDCAVTVDVGEDFDEYYGEWFDSNYISRDYLNVVDAHTMNTILEYHEDSSYYDHSKYGGPFTHHCDALRLSNDHYIPYYPMAEKAVYVFNTTDYVDEARKKYGFKVTLEVKNNATADDREPLLGYLENVDLYSLNRNECGHIFGLKTEEECIRQILTLEKPCFFRLGTKGSMMICDGKAWFVPIVHISSEEGDPTGCGNSSTCAAMWAYFEGYDPLMTACIANVVAGYNAQQMGPVPRFTQELRKDVFARAERLYGEIKETARII